MKTKISILTFVPYLLAIALISCTQTSEKNNEITKEKMSEVQEDLNKAKENFKVEYQKFKLETDRKIHENEIKITELKEKRLKVKKENQAKFDQRVNELEQKNNALRSKMNTYTDEGKEKWESFKKEFNHDIDELGLALKDLFKDNIKE